MGKKLKVGKTRKDKFYHLAKETGYRSRSSFKLIQLNRKYQFLQKARALIDLCAAPGGWLQVASKFMPVSSLVIGVDLVPIKPIPNVVTLQEDITTEKCRQALKKELQTWKVDVVLNDGAPNVGANWQHDAFSQAHLTLMALKLASEFLAKGGTFVTKVFRSKDYQPLLWIFQQFFKKVQATKPQASRNESAEIFVICQGFLAPDKIDAKFFDPKYAFKEVEVQAKTVKDLVPDKKPKAEGYTDGDLTLFHSCTVMNFVKAENPVDFLSKASEITFDNPKLEAHSTTTDEIKECCRDIKVLGRKELRMLLNWRTKLRRYLAKTLKEEAKKLDQEISLSSDEEGDDSEDELNKKKEEEEEVDEEEEMEKKIAELKADEVADLKRKKRKLLKERRKQRERVELKMDLPGVSIADNNDVCLFSLHALKKKKALTDISKGDMKAAEFLLEEEGEDDIHLSDDEEDQADNISLASDLDEEELEEVERRQKELKKKEKKKVTFDKEEEVEDDDNEEEGSGLLVELEGKDEKTERETNLWFSKDIFSEIELEGDAESELRQTLLLQTQQPGKGKKRKAEEVEQQEEVVPIEKEVAEPSQEVAEDSDSDSDDSDDEGYITKLKQANVGTKKSPGADDDKDFQVVPVESNSKKARILDAEGLAIGTMIATSKKKTRDLVDNSFHRFASSDEAWEVPEWFLNDELKHRRKPVPVTKEMVEEYKQKWKEIDARPIKRVAEAKARKKRRMLKKMEQAKKKAEAVVNTVDISEREKMAQLKSIYKKAGVGKEKREVTYVVAKKGAGKKVRRPAGVKGVFRVVDGRMKKDTRGLQRKDQKAKGGKGKGRQAKGGKKGVNTNKGRKAK
ncbi:pre-rRNA 2'-O-ribose RNA methyltransferase FTSJ3 [Corythoichthys intestinalis]|uniref:pre-rRNA 2'-O-ribose RNA methyltransferase FTSJ3 n=1 Tax=Corythoichthys intestinalis TaxID=161448 RepID=UPI0025A6179E|nr:pre-rRNA 2'-O-ribose RNA methyltransferase FTSJ3 [Corythoichthys intestinalis]XP_061791141.1 pre-rRNA 2'-O-ribose RNA methyltransferase FTSJ3 [Nerophis lumbriciformis]